MELVLILGGAGLIVLGFVGCVLPVLPGPPLGFVGLLALWWARAWDAATFGTTAVLILGVAAILTTALDFVLPAIGAKRYGASKAGVWGSVLGMVLGAVFYPPFGMLIGAFLGALVFELMGGKESAAATRAAWGVFVGTIAGIVMKVAAVAAITWVYVRELTA